MARLYRNMRLFRLALPFDQEMCAEQIVDVVRRGSVLTPPASDDILEGITRNAIRTLHQR